MRYVAIFTQAQTPISYGFDELTAALDFLDWVHHEQEVIPEGVYDIESRRAIPYTFVDRSVSSNPASICHMAIDYLKSHRQWTCL